MMIWRKSLTPKTDTEVQTILGSSSKPMMKVDVNASPEPVSVMGDVICDDLHLCLETISENFRNYWVQRGAASCQH